MIHDLGLSGWKNPENVLIPHKEETKKKGGEPTCSPPRDG
jgi:hypothetical protein